MVILPDGFPARNEHGRAVVHPLYGVYLVNAFLTAYRKTGDARDRRAMEVVAQRQSGACAPSVLGSCSGTTRARAYRSARRGTLRSAPTQAYYAEALADAAAVLHDRRLRQAASAVFASLLIPGSKGGVNRPVRLGPVLEEEPWAARPRS